MEIVSVALLAVLNLQVAALWWLSRPDKSEPEAATATPPALAQSGGIEFPAMPPARPAKPCSAEDRRVEALIQAVDPSWTLGDPRKHIELVPDAEGRIVEARLR
jgi:hypothetical protein